MSDEVVIKPTGEWLYNGEDSRLRREREAKQVQGRLGRVMDPVFCVNCGTPQGFGQRTSWVIIVVCDDCFEKFGGPPLPQLPLEDEIKWRNGKLQGK